MPAVKYLKNIFRLVGLVLSACQPTSIETAFKSLPSPSSPNPIATYSLAKTLPKQSQLNPIFDSILPVLKAKTKLSICLPTYIPESDEPNPIYALLESVSPSKYRIMLAFTNDCLGGTACRLGGVSAEAVTSKSPALEGKTVTLANSITGYFVDATCGANCSDSTLTWQQNGVRYTVAIKAGDVATLEKMANSTITKSPLNQKP
jgi:hypothetical protein